MECTCVWLRVQTNSDVAVEDLGLDFSLKLSVSSLVVFKQCL